MARNEKTSKKLASLASRAMTDPQSLTPAEIRSLGATALTQTADRPRPKPKPKAKPKARK